MRIHKWLAAAGVCSRRQGEAWIRAGRVAVNGNREHNPATQICPQRDRICVDGKPIAAALPAPEVWLLYKPKQCMCTLADPQGRATIRRYFPNTQAQLRPAGRLDYDAEGLLLLTNHGLLLHRLTHPSAGLHKSYLVKVRGTVSADTLQRLGAGFVLEGAPRLPIKAQVIHVKGDKTWLDVVLKEGVQHLIKKAFFGFGHRVLKIKRYQIGPITLADLQPGQTQPLLGTRLQTLYAHCGLAAQSQSLQR